MVRNICIIGGGWYGCYIAEYLIDNYPDLQITLIDKAKTIFNGSSFNNQNRLHLGFHYPRCKITKNKSEKYYHNFLNKYKNCSDDIEKNYYLIAKNSKIDYEKYINLYDDKYFNIIDNNDTFTNIDGNIIDTKEKYIDFKKVKEYFKKKVSGNNVKFLFNYKVNSICQESQQIIINNEYKFDKVFNCTYNQIRKNKNVIYEKCLTLLYKKKNNIPFNSVTIMDGDFCSLYKYYNDLFSLTSVKYTPLIKSKNFEIVEKYNNYDLKNKIRLFEENIKLFYKDFNKNFEYVDFFESYKCKNISKNDSRDININIDDNLFNVWCGKITFIFELDEHIDKFIIS